MRAYVLVNTKPGKARDIARAITELPGAQMANICWGMPDIFVVVEVASDEELNKLVLDGIQSIVGVERTETHIAAE